MSASFSRVVSIGADSRPPMRYGGDVRRTRATVPAATVTAPIVDRAPRTVVMSCLSGHGALTGREYGAIYTVRGGIFAKGWNYGGCDFALLFIPETDSRVESLRAACTFSDVGICTKMTSNAAIERAFNRPGVVCSA